MTWGVIEVIVGRRDELAAINSFLDAVSDAAASLVLEGEPGIGKSTLWRAALRMAAERSYRILSASPAESESGFPYAVLTDLLEGCDASLIASLPEPQARSVEVALLRRRVEGPPAEQHSISLAALTMLRRFSEQSPVIVAIDDSQWIDSPSSRVLQFAFRRLENEPIGILLATRLPADPHAALHIDRGFRLNRISRLHVTDMPADTLIDVLHLWLPAVFSRPTLARISEVSAGNPFFALEIGRSLLRRGLVPAGEPLPIPENVKELVRARIDPLPEASNRVLFVVAAIAHPSESLLERILGTEELTVGLERAVEAALLVREGDRIRFAHPLIGTVAYGDASRERRRQLHRGLANLVGDPEEHARHLALAAEGPDEEVARALEIAAAAANARGAPDAAASLSEQALRMTPGDRPDGRRRRVLSTADFHIAAGDLLRARGLLEAAARERPDYVQRAVVFHRLGQIEFSEGNLAKAEAFCNDAVASVAENLQLEAAIRRDLQIIANQQAKYAVGEAHARIRLRLAERSENPAELEAARVGLAAAEFFLGRGLPQELHHEAAAIAQGTAIGPRDSNPPILPHLLDLAAMLKWADDLDNARPLLTQLLEQASAQYDESFRAPVLFHLGELECWAGNWKEADEYAQTCQKATQYSGRAGLRLLPLTLAAQLGAVRGQVSDARTAAHNALSLAIERGDVLFQMRNLRTLGFLELSLGDAERAQSYLVRLREHGSRSGGTDPGILRFEGDDIESVIALGHLDQAAWALELLEMQGQSLRRKWAMAVATRCRALLSAARGDLHAAEGEITRALDESQDLQQPFELARTSLVAGTIARRNKQKASAVDRLRRAFDMFNTLGAALWVAKVDAELTRIGGRSPAQRSLTPTEARVAALVASGRRNREIGRELFMSVKTVEANLSRIYRKLDIRSRSELAARIARSDSSGPPGNQA